MKILIQGVNPDSPEREFTASCNKCYTTFSFERKETGSNIDSEAKFIRINCPICKCIAVVSVPKLEKPQVFVTTAREEAEAILREAEVNGIEGYQHAVEHIEKLVTTWRKTVAPGMAFEDSIPF